MNISPWREQPDWGPPAPLSSALVPGGESAMLLHRLTENQIHHQVQHWMLHVQVKLLFWKEHHFIFFSEENTTFKIPRTSKSMKPNLVIKINILASNLCLDFKKMRHLVKVHSIYLLSYKYINLRLFYSLNHENLPDDSIVITRMHVTL